MKGFIYSKILNITSHILNYCIKHNFWWMSKILIDIRKKKIAKILSTGYVSEDLFKAIKEDKNATQKR